MKKTLAQQFNNFESIKKITIDKNGNQIEYWSARDLYQLLGYTEWRNFKTVIEKAINACINSGFPTSDHFVDVNKMIKIATGTEKETLRKLDDYHLTRYACYPSPKTETPENNKLPTPKRTLQYKPENKK
ncbi:MAG: BRO family protein [bacterium]